MNKNLRNYAHWYLGLAIFFGLIALGEAIFNWQLRRQITRLQKKQKSPDLTSTKPATSQNSTVSYQYTTKTFHLEKIQGLSKKQIDEHLLLYAGYIKKRNEIEQNLQTVDRSNVDNRTYSPFRALKIAQTYAINGAILHELYFENLGQAHTTVGPKMHKLIEQNFGSLEQFKKDLMDCAGCSRGWVVTAYSIDDKKMHNFVLEEHNQTVPVLIMPLLVLDVYEHAYMIDFGIKRAPYLTVFWDNINWDIIEQRIEKWVEPFAIISK